MDTLLPLGILVNCKLAPVCTTVSHFIDKKTEAEGVKGLVQSHTSGEPTGTVRDNNHGSKHQAYEEKVWAEVPEFVFLI